MGQVGGASRWSQVKSTVSGWGTQAAEWGNRHVRVLSVLPFASLYVTYKILSQPKPSAVEASLLPKHSAKYLDKYSTAGAIVIGIPVLGSLIAPFVIMHEKGRAFQDKRLLSLIQNPAATNAQIDIKKFKNLNPRELSNLLQKLHESPEKAIEVHENSKVAFILEQVIASKEPAARKEYVKELISAMKPLGHQAYIDTLVKCLTTPASIPTEIAQARKEVEFAILEAKWQNVDIGVDTRWEYDKNKSGETSDVMHALKYVCLDNYDPQLQLGFDEKCKPFLSADAVKAELDENEDCMAALQKAVKQDKLFGKDSFADLFKNGHVIADEVLSSLREVAVINHEDANKIEENFNRIEFACTLLQRCDTLTAQQRGELLAQIAKNFNQIGAVFPRRNISNAQLNREVHVMMNVLMEFNKLNRDDLNLPGRKTRAGQIGPETSAALKNFYENANRFIQQNVGKLVTITPEDQKKLNMIDPINKQLFLQKAPPLKLSKLPIYRRVPSEDDVNKKIGELNSHKKTLLADPKAFFDKVVKDNKVFLAHPGVQQAIKDMINELPADMQQRFVNGVIVAALQQKTAFLTDPRTQATLRNMINELPRETQQRVLEDAIRAAMQKGKAQTVVAFFTDMYRGIATQEAAERYIQEQQALVPAGAVEAEALNEAAAPSEEELAAEQAQPVAKERRGVKTFFKSKIEARKAVKAAKQAESADRATQVTQEAVERAADLNDTLTSHLTTFDLLEKANKAEFNAQLTLDWLDRLSEPIVQDNLRTLGVNVSQLNTLIQELRDIITEQQEFAEEIREYNQAKKNDRLEDAEPKAIEAAYNKKWQLYLEPVHRENLDALVGIVKPHLHSLSKASTLEMRMKYSSYNAVEHLMPNMQEYSEDLLRSLSTVNMEQDLPITLLEKGLQTALAQRSEPEAPLLAALTNLPEGGMPPELVILKEALEQKALADKGVITASQELASAQAKPKLLQSRREAEKLSAAQTTLEQALGTQKETQKTLQRALKAVEERVELERSNPLNKLLDNLIQSEEAVERAQSALQATTNIVAAKKRMAEITANKANGSSYFTRFALLSAPSAPGIDSRRDLNEFQRDLQDARLLECLSIIDSPETDIRIRQEFINSAVDSVKSQASRVFTTSFDKQLPPEVSPEAAYARLMECPAGDELLLLTNPMIDEAQAQIDSIATKIDTIQTEIDRLDQELSLMPADFEEERGKIIDAMIEATPAQTAKLEAQLTALNKKEEELPKLTRKRESLILEQNRLDEEISLLYDHIDNLESLQCSTASIQTYVQALPDERRHHVLFREKYKGLANTPVEELPALLTQFKTEVQSTLSELDTAIKLAQRNKQPDEVARLNGERETYRGFQNDLNALDRLAQQSMAFTQHVGGQSLQTALATAAPIDNLREPKIATESVLRDIKRFLDTHQEKTRQFQIETFHTNLLNQFHDPLLENFNTLSKQLVQDTAKLRSEGTRLTPEEKIERSERLDAIEVAKTLATDNPVKLKKLEDEEGHLRQELESEMASSREKANELAARGVALNKYKEALDSLENTFKELKRAHPNQSFNSLSTATKQNIENQLELVSAAHHAYMSLPGVAPDFSLKFRYWQAPPSVRTPQPARAQASQVSTPTTPRAAPAQAQAPVTRSAPQATALPAAATPTQPKKGLRGIFGRKQKEIPATTSSLPPPAAAPLRPAETTSYRSAKDAARKEAETPWEAAATREAEAAATREAEATASRLNAAIIQDRAKDKARTVFNLFHKFAYNSETASREAMLKGCEELNAMLQNPVLNVDQLTAAMLGKEGMIPGPTIRAIEQFATEPSRTLLLKMIEGQYRRD